MENRDISHYPPLSPKESESLENQVTSSSSTAFGHKISLLPSSPSLSPPLSPISQSTAEVSHHLLDQTTDQESSNLENSLFSTKKISMDTFPKEQLDKTASIVTEIATQIITLPNVHSVAESPLQALCKKSMNHIQETLKNASHEERIALFSKASVEEIDLLFDLLNQIESKADRFASFVQLPIELLPVESCSRIWSQLPMNVRAAIFTQRGDKIESQILEKLPTAARIEISQYLLQREYIDGLMKLDPKIRMQQLNELPIQECREILHQCSTEECLEILQGLSLQERVHVLSRLQTQRVIEIVHRLPKKDQMPIKTLIMQEIQKDLSLTTRLFNNIAKIKLKKYPFKTIEASVKSNLIQLVKELNLEEQKNLFTEEALIKFAEREYPTLANDPQKIRTKIQSKEFIETVMNSTEYHQLYSLVFSYLLQKESALHTEMTMLLGLVGIQKASIPLAEYAKLLSSVRRTIENFHIHYTKLTQKLSTPIPHEEPEAVASREFIIKQLLHSTRLLLREKEKNRIQ